MTMNDQDLTPLQWALPEALEVPPDTLRLRLDFYSETIVMHKIEEGVISNRTVSPLAIASAMTREITFSSGLLPVGALWWSHSRWGDLVALWRKPQVTRVAIQLDPFKPPARFTLPMPGLVFICQPSRAPWVFAAKKRPTSPKDLLYHCPTFNVYSGGHVCPGNHDFPADLTKIPESFFQSHFSVTGDPANRSVKYNGNMMALWEELDGQRKYPLSDLVKWGPVSKILNGTAPAF